jgi:hypothetical protein
MRSVLCIDCFAGTGGGGEGGESGGEGGTGEAPPGKGLERHVRVLDYVAARLTEPARFAAQRSNHGAVHIAFVLVPSGLSPRSGAA